MENDDVPLSCRILTPTLRTISQVVQVCHNSKRSDDFSCKPCSPLCLLFVFKTSKRLSLFVSLDSGWEMTALLSRKIAKQIVFDCFYERNLEKEKTWRWEMGSGAQRKCVFKSFKIMLCCWNWNSKLIIPVLCWFFIWMAHDDSNSKDELFCPLTWLGGYLV